MLAALIAEGWLIVHMLGQNGRLLLKVDELEERIGQIAQGGGQAAAPAAPKPAAAQPARGLPIGSPAPGFKLEGIHGETMTLDALRAQGKPVMLIFSDPGCGPCNALMPEVAGWQREHAGSLTLAILSRGKAEVNQEKAEKAGLNLVFLQKDREISEAYKALGTPSAVIVNRDGTIGSQVEGGAERIRELVRSFTGSRPVPQAQQQAAPSGNGQARPNGAAANGGARQPAPAKLPVGAEAPDLTLTDLSGKTMSISDFKGSDTVLIFWSPTCGFCKRMADDITAWEQAPRSDYPKAVIITSGDVEANRAFGFTSTVLMDPQTSAMKDYGTSGTPTAIKIDKDGRIASDLRVGQPGVMSLLRNEPAPAAAAAPPAPKALQIGEPAPAVKLPDINGEQFDLASLKGQKAAVVFWNPGCGFCKRMADDLRAWEDQRPADAPRIVLVSTGSVDANKEMGLSSTMLIDQGFQIGRSFGASGTPSAVLIDEEGRIASGVAVGAPRVLELAGAPQPV
jgi:peroxiredoxin